MDAIFQAKNGVKIDAENPVMHDHPSYCFDCRCWYYFNHICPENVHFPVKRGRPYKLGSKGFYEDNE